MTDQQPISCVGAYGNDQIKTPHLDALAGEGQLLKNFYIAAFPCSPSRASILTGRYLHNHNVFTNNVILDPTIPSLGTVLSEEGYRTGYFGKAHLGGYMYVGRTGGDGVDYLHLPGEAKDPVGDEIKDYWHHKRIETASGWNTQRRDGGYGEDEPQLGFTEWKGGWKDYKDWLVSKGRRDFAEIAGNHDDLQSAPEGEHMYSLLGEEYHMATYFTNETESFIKRNTNDNEPWAAVLSYFGPHLPVAPPQPWDDMYPLEEIPLPANFEDDLNDKPQAQRKANLQYVLGQWNHDQYKDYIRRYWGYSSFIDQQIGRIFQLLKETNQWENTVVIFTTDHGDMAGGHGMIYKLGSNAYEELFHVPAILRIPNLGHKGREIEALSSAIDVLPTILNAVNIDIPKGIDGQDLSPQLSGSVKDSKSEVFAEIHFPGRDGKVIMCRGEQFKYVYHWMSEDVDELYDLENDPGELENLYGSESHKEVVKEMQQKIIDWSKDTGHQYAKLIGQKALLEHRK